MIRASLIAVCMSASHPCAAHTFLDGSIPRVGSENLAAPDKVALHFTQAVEPAFSTIEVDDATGAAVTDGQVYVEKADATGLAIKLRKLGPGVFTVIWHVTSRDAHKTQGKFHFTVTR